MADIFRAKMISPCGLANVKRIILVSSGKGGVGKSTVATNLALSLRRSNHSVGLLDTDLCGPSIPSIFGLEAVKVKKCDEDWLPVHTGATNPEDRDRFVLMSMGFLLAEPTDGVVWRGAKKNAMIENMLTQVHWGHLDYLVIDTPPGTSDEKITVANALKSRHMSQFAGVVIVTSPQMVALTDVRKDISFYSKIGLPVLGLVENMSGLCCPRCSHIDRVFSAGGGESLARARNIRFLGSLPILPGLTETARDTESATGVCESMRNLMLQIESAAALV